MKRILKVIPVIFTCLFLFACSEEPNTSNSQTSKDEEVTLLFIQHTFLDSSLNDEGYYFKNDVIKTTTFTYPKGYFLSKSDIDGFNVFTLNHIVPPLNGDGYFSFTFFMIEFDEETGHASKHLKPMYLNEDLVVHFAIYG